MSDKFISLHNHTSEGSLLDAIVKYDELINRAKQLGQESIAITDHGSVFSIYNCYKHSKKVGIKLIPGNEFYFVHDPNDDEERGNKHLVLLARNEIGWRNILKLNYLAWQKQKTIFMKQYPRITWDDIEQHNEGIIALTACSSGVLSRHIMHNDLERANKDASRLKNIFGDNFFLEIQPHTLKTDNGKVDQVRVNCELVKIARDQDIRLAATCDAHYLNANDAVYHDMLLAIKDKKAVSDEDRHKYSVNEFYLKPGTDIVNFFGEALGRELISNSQLINTRCESPDYLAPNGAHLPEFPVCDAKDYTEFLDWKERNVKNDLPEDAAYLRFKTARGFQQSYEHLDPEQVDEYWTRIKSEIKVIEEKEFSSYMLIVADFINWAKENDIEVGPARGSAAGSLVSKVLGITTPDPMDHGLLFARFLNRLKKAFPDIDVDFSAPDRVKEYVKKKYGDKRVAGISNVMKMTPKVVVKDVARSLELGGSKTEAFKISNELTNLIPDKGIDSIEHAIEVIPDLAPFFKKYPELLAHCKRLQNIERGSGQHAAGVIIADQDLDELAPLRMDREGNLIMAWDKDQCEENGFIKMDFLGLKTLAVIGNTLKMIKLNHGKTYTMQTIPLNDPDVFEMISRADVKCIFQLEETAGPFCKAIKPKNIEDIAVITTIVRPAVPTNERQDYIDRRFGRQEVTYIHPKMANATKETFGILMYEEQLMFVAKDVAGWDFDRADALRKITKLKEKGKELAEKTEIEFLNDAVANGMEYEKAKEIWDRLEQFAGYGFNKSHAVSYSYISYYTAWLKYHYPTEFMTAILNSEDPNSETTQEYKQVARKLGIEITPPDINKSKLMYSVIGDKKIATGLFAIKGVGEGAINYMIERQPYSSYKDFLHKVSGTKENRSPVNKKIFEGLAKAGAFDCLSITRKNAHEGWKEAKQKITAYLKKNKDSKNVDGLAWDFENPLDEWTKEDILRAERESVGEYLSGTANDIYKNFFIGGPMVLNLKNLPSYPNKETVKIEALIKIKVGEKKIKKVGKNFGKMYARFMIEDIAGSTAELTIWPDQYKKFKKCLLEGTPIRAICGVNDFMGVKTLVLKEIEDIPGYVHNREIINKVVIKDEENLEESD